MADEKLSALTALAAKPAADDEVYIRDVSEAAAAESKRITMANLIHPETLPELLKGGNLLHIPTNAGWTESLAGSGGVGQLPFVLVFDTGTAANSIALLETIVVAFDFSQGHRFRVFWNKKLYIIFRLIVPTPTSDGIGRLQLKETPTEGALAANGIGIRLDNLALKGESYGSAGSVAIVDLATTLTIRESVLVAIIHFPGTKIEWWVNTGAGLTLRGTQNTSNNIPSGMAGTDNRFVVSAMNQSSAVRYYIEVSQPKIWQEA